MINNSQNKTNEKLAKLKPIIKDLICNYHQNINVLEYLYDSVDEIKEEEEEA